MNLSRHFTLAELTFSRTATAEGIDNTPADAERANLEALCSSVLDPLRDAAGGPIKVTSGYRGPTLNKRIGGERASQHLEGRAADIQPPASMSVLDLFKAVVRAALPFDQLIYEPKSATSRWVHVSHNGATNRGQILVAHFLPTGKVARYEPVSAQQVLEMQEAVSRSARRVDELDYDEMDDEPMAPAPAKAKPVKAPAKSVAKKGTAKKVAKKAVKKLVVKKTTAGKAAAKKTAPKKTAAKKATAKKTTAKKAPAKKGSAKTAKPRNVAAKAAAAKRSRRV